MGLLDREHTGWQLLSKKGTDFSSLEGKFLRFTMPSAVCSFCAGQMQLSQKGNGGRMKRMWKEAKDGDSTGTL